MSTQRKHASAECKARGALEALKGLKTVHELARPSGVHPPPMAPLSGVGFFESSRDAHRFFLNHAPTAPAS